MNETARDKIKSLKIADDFVALAEFERRLEIHKKTEDVRLSMDVEKEIK